VAPPYGGFKRMGNRLYQKFKILSLYAGGQNNVLLPGRPATVLYNTKHSEEKVARAGQL